MGIKLQVQLLEARNLVSRDSNGLSDPFVRLAVGKSKARSATVYKSLNPSWHEEFLFNVDDVSKDVLAISVWDEDFLGPAEFLGQIELPVELLTSSEGQPLSATWYKLQQRKNRVKYAISGEIRLAFSVWGANSFSLQAPPHKELPPHSSSYPKSALRPARMSDQAVLPDDMFDDIDCDSDASLSASSSDASSRSPSLRKTDSWQKGEAPQPHAAAADGGSQPSPMQQASSFITTLSSFGPKGKAGAKGGAKNPFLAASSIRQRLVSQVGSSSIGGGGGGAGSQGTAQLPSLPSMSAFKSPSIAAAFPTTSSIMGRIVRAPSSNSEVSSSDADGEDSGGAAVEASWFESDKKDVPSGGDLPGPLAGGVVLDQTFVCAPHELNAIIFKQDSEFYTEFMAERKATQVEAGNWMRGDVSLLPGSEDHAPLHDCVHRHVTYMTAPSALVKSVKASETFAFSRADAGGFVVTVAVATPDVPYGNTFRTELQFCISPTKDGGSQLVVSWRAIFLQSTMMKSMIENGMRTGIKEAYVTFLEVLLKFAKPSATAKVSVDAADRPKTFSDHLRFALDLLSVLILFLSLLLLPIHFSRVHSTGSSGGGSSGGSGSAARGLEFEAFFGLRLDLPDSSAELIATAVIVLAAVRAEALIRNITLARLLRRGDHGKKGTGEGWTVALSLVEGEGVAGTGLTGLSDPYVVFTCNGKTRTSSVKLQTNSPRWNEYLEFDAFEDPPSMMDVEVFDYDGPFSESESLGRAEINFLKQSTQDLADFWLPLEGKKAKAAGYRIHLRVFLSNSSDAATPKLLEKISKEVGSKVSINSAEKNESFQKLFDLPEHEFLINDFSCAVKKKIPMQGRLFLSPRLLAFYSNIFGKKIKITLLWEDIEEIKENAPTINTINRILNPSMTAYMKKGRALDARIASYGVDPSGRLKIRFQSFVRPSIAFRTISVLWRNRLLAPEEKMKKVEEVQGEGAGQGEDNSTFVGSDALEMLDQLDMEIPVTVEQFLCVVEEQRLVDKLASSLGQTNYEVSEWVVDEGFNGMRKQRTVKYRFARSVCSFGTAVSVMQQATKDPDLQWATIEDWTTLLEVPFGDHFQIYVKREVKTQSSKPPLSTLTSALGIAWQKKMSEKTKEKIRSDIAKFHTAHSRKIAETVVKEVIAATQS